MDTIRILIADDQTITRSGLRTLLESLPNLEIVGEAGNGAEAVELAEQLQPDVILMDLRMPVINGIEATRRIHRANPHIGILVVTIFQDDTSVFPAIRAGARELSVRMPTRPSCCRPSGTVAQGGGYFQSRYCWDAALPVSEP
ncbi:MAG: response regulator transcription factor [Anaerolineae bacterium]